MRFLQYINEEYVGTYKDDPRYEIFINPTPKELRSFTSVRFIADHRTKNFFIIYSLLLHEPFVNELRRRKLMKDQCFECFMGQGEVKMSLIDFDEFSWDWGQPPDEDMQKLYKWTQKYFTPESIKRLWK